jgi:hypothetical protein
MDMHGVMFEDTDDSCGECVDRPRDLTSAPGGHRMARRRGIFETTAVENDPARHKHSLNVEKLFWRLFRGAARETERCVIIFLNAGGVERIFPPPNVGRLGPHHALTTRGARPYNEWRNADTPTPLTRMLRVRLGDLARHP